jgi:hypothetical protein
LGKFASFLTKTQAYYVKTGVSELWRLIWFVIITIRSIITSYPIHFNICTNEWEIGIILTLIYIIIYINILHCDLRK